MQTAKQSTKISFLSGLLLVYLLLVTLWPFYIDIRLSANVGVNPQRIISGLFAVLFLLGFMPDRNHRMFMTKHIGENSRFYIPFIFYFGWRVLSALSSGRPISIFVMLYELTSYFVIYFGFLICIFYEGRRRLLLGFLTAAALVLIALCFVEGILQYNYFAQFASRQDRIAISSQEIIRAGSHRVKGTFEHPLTLVQYIALIMPLLVVATAGLYRSSTRFAWLILFVFVLLMTKSRSAIAFLGAVFFLYFWAKYITRRMPNRLPTPPFLLWIGVALIAACFTIISFTSEYYGRTYLDSPARKAQLINGVIAVAKAPMLGYGPGAPSGVILYEISRESRFAEKMWARNAMTVDNRYITIAIESGIPGLFFFLSFNFIVLYHAYCELKESGIALGRTQEWYWLLASMMSCVGALIVMVILSIFTVHSVYFIVLASLVYSTDIIRKQRIGNSVAAETTRAVT